MRLAIVAPSGASAAAGRAEKASRAVATRCLFIGRILHVFR
jgi:hypothetical protein